MEEKKDRIIEKTEGKELPVLRISVTNIEITVEEGRVYHGSFLIESEQHTGAGHRPLHQR